MAETLIKKESLAQVFFCKYRTTASAFSVDIWCPTVVPTTVLLKKCSHFVCFLCYKIFFSPVNNKFTNTFSDHCAFKKVISIDLHLIFLFVILNNSSVNKFTNTLSHKLNVSSWTPLSLSCFLFLSYHYFHIFLVIDFCNWFSNIDFKKLTSGFIKQTLLSGQICFFIIFVLFIYFL